MGMEARFWAGGFLYNAQDHTVLLHQRDGNTKINPNKWAFFGGLNEGNEDPTDCLIREVREEIGLTLSRDQVIPLRDYLNTELNTYRYVFYARSTVDRAALVLGEGAGFDWVPLAKLDEYDLTEKSREDLQFFLSRTGE